MAFCQNCGTQLAEGAKFCENCGAPVETLVKEEVVEVVSTPVESEPLPVRNTPEQESAAKNAMILSIVGLALAEAGLPGIIVSAIAKGKVKKATAMGAIGGKLKAARILSNIGLALSIVMTIFWLLYCVLIGGVVAYGIYDGAFDSFEDMMMY